MRAHPMGRFQDGSLVRPSPTENKAWCKPNPNHISIHVVPGQLVTERIGLENGIVLSFSSLTTEVGGRMPPATSGSWTGHPQPHRGGSTVGGLSPRWRVVSLPLPPFGHAPLLVSQLAAMYHFLFHHTLNGRFLAGKGTFNAYFRR